MHYAYVQFPCMSDWETASQALNLDVFLATHTINSLEILALHLQKANLDLSSSTSDSRTTYYKMQEQPLTHRHPVSGQTLPITGIYWLLKDSAHKGCNKEKIKLPKVKLLARLTHATALHNFHCVPNKSPWKLPIPGLTHRKSYHVQVITGKHH